MTLERDDVEGVDTMTDDEAEQALEIRTEIEETRIEMGGTLSELGDRLEPGHLMSQAKDNVRDATIGRVEETAKGMSDMVMETIKQNPIPAALAGHPDRRGRRSLRPVADARNTEEQDLGRGDGDGAKPIGEAEQTKGSPLSERASFLVPG